MTLQSFLDQCLGKWFSQRTSHALPPEELETGKADLWVEPIATTDSQLQTYCQQAGLNPQAVTGLRTRWEGQVGVEMKKEVGSSILIFSSATEAPTGWVGKFVQSSSLGGLLTGTYQLNTEGALSIVAESNQLKTEERIWFAGENLRERTSIVTHLETGEAYAAFCSEIRLAAPQPA